MRLVAKRSSGHEFDGAARKVPGALRGHGEIFQRTCGADLVLPEHHTSLRVPTPVPHGRARGGYVCGGEAQPPIQAGCRTCEKNTAVWNRSVP
eukprot:8251936-Pyramimonas_sp.AAC.1